MYRCQAARVKSTFAVPYIYSSTLYAMTSPNATKRPLLRLFPVLLLNLIAFGVAIPIVPALAKKLGAGGLEVGLIFAVQALGQFLMAPLWGKLSDKTGRKPVLLVTIFAAALVDVLTANATSLWMVFVTRFIAGLCAGNIATASALVTDATDTKNRSKGLAIIGICFGLGFTIGPGIGALAALSVPDAIGPFGKGFPFLVSAGINALASILGAWLLVEPSDDLEARAHNRLLRRPDSIGQMLKRPSIRVMCILFLAYSIAVTIMETTFFLYMADRYGYNESQVGGIFAGMGLLAALVQGGVGRISAKVGDIKMTTIGGILLGLGIGVAVLWEQLIFLLVFLSIASIGRALLQPGSLSLMSSQSTQEDENGKVMGIAQSAQSLGRIIGPAAGGVLFDVISPRAPFMASGIILLSVLVWWFVAFKKVVSPHESLTSKG